VQGLCSVACPGGAAPARELRAQGCPPEQGPGAGDAVVPPVLLPGLSGHREMLAAAGAAEGRAMAFSVLAEFLGGRARSGAGQMAFGSDPAALSGPLGCCATVGAAGSEQRCRSLLAPMGGCQGARAEEGWGASRGMEPKPSDHDANSMRAAVPDSPWPWEERGGVW